MNIAVSVVTSTFNRLNLLKETVECIIGQTYSNLEYIIVDDGSSDGTAAYLETLPKTIRVITQSNTGQVAALAEGWRQSSGEYLAYLSDDDLLMPDAIARLAGHLHSHSRTMAVFPNAHLIDLDGRVVQRAVCKPFCLRQIAVEQQCFVGPGALFRRSAYEATGGWDPRCRLLPDLEFWTRLGSLGPIDFMADEFALYRIHPGSLSVPHNRSKAMVEEHFYVIEKFFDGPWCPAALRPDKHLALAHAHLIAARSDLRGGDVRRLMRSLAAAYRHDKNSLNARSVAKLAASLVPVSVKQHLHRLARSRRPEMSS